MPPLVEGEGEVLEEDVLLKGRQPNIRYQGATVCNMAFPIVEQLGTVDGLTAVNIERTKRLLIEEGSRQGIPTITQAEGDSDSGRRSVLLADPAGEVAAGVRKVVTIVLID